MYDKIQHEAKPSAVFATSAVFYRTAQVYGAFTDLLGDYYIVHSADSVSKHDRIVAQSVHHEARL